MCWGSANPVGPSRCDSYRSPSTSTSFSPPVTFCEKLYEKDPANPGMAVLAAQFTDTDRVEYLDKA